MFFLDPELGFSKNKHLLQVYDPNISDETIEAIRLVKDYIDSLWWTG